MHSRSRSEQLYNSGMNYVDGIPVKIGEKFKPPRKVTLPLNFHQRDPIELLNSDYNFKLEKQILEWSENLRKKKEEKTKAKTEQVAHQIEQFTRLPPSPEGQVGSSDNSPNSVSTLPSSSGDSVQEIGTDGSGNDSSGEQIHPPLSCALLANLETNDILKPTPLDFPKTSPSHLGEPNSHSTSIIKLEDFESESSPFDSVELKTLNDMEELKSVLQGIETSKSESFSSAIGENEKISRLHSKSALNGTIQYYPGGSHINGVVSYTPGFQQPAPVNFPVSQRDNCKVDYRKSSGSHSHNLISAVSTNSPLYTNVNQNYAYVSGPHSASWSSSNLYSSPFYSQASMKTSSQESGSQLSDYNLLTSTYFSAESPNYQLSNLVSTPGSDSSSSSGSLRNAHSTPDLLKELGRTHKDEKRHSHFHPPRPNSVGSVEEAAGITYEPKPKQVHLNLKDVTCELNTDEQLLVRRLVDMGFSQARAARAVQKLGNNDKKVVEHLCAVQALTENGYSVERSEMALFLHDQNEDKAKEYLQLMKQFLDLGFEEEAIKRALCLTKNNRDKALDYLVS